MNRTTRNRRLGTVAVVAGSLVAAGLAAVPAVAAPAQNGCDNRTNNTYSKVLECVRVEGVREHQAALQAIADANNGNRVSGSPGYDESVDYAVEVFEAAGMDVAVQDFTFATFITLSPTILERVSPAPAGTTSRTSSATPAAVRVTSPVTTSLLRRPTRTRGCEAARLRRLPRRRHRPRQPGLVLVRHQGAERGGRRGLRRRHLQQRAGRHLNGTLGNDASTSTSR